ncbi:MAG: endopeptidase La [Myxococcales bacterium]|nr:endopeptidase La [Myxococcales bacterium]
MSGPSRRPASGELPLLPLRSMTLLPGIGQPVELGRHASVDAIRMARERPRDDPRHRLIVVATQREELTERPDLDDLYPVGVLAEVTQALLGVGSRMNAIVRGIERVHLLELDRTQSPTVVRYQRAHEPLGDPTLAYAMAGTLQDLVRQHDGLLPANAQNKQRTHALSVINGERAPARIADLCATHVGLEPAELAELLHELTVTERLRKVLEFVSHRIHVLQVKRDLDRHVREHLSKHEQEALLRHKLRAIQSELGDDDQGLGELEVRLEEADLPAEARGMVERELSRLRRMNPQSGEATIVRTYLELVADLPWGEHTATPDSLDIEAARGLLEREHYGLDKVKRRIIEYLCVRKLAPHKRGPILCLAGPPGVGKTSLARSIAQTLGRQFVRVSLGGVRDDSEIRGHRRTYVGALPGRILQGMKRAGSKNPVFLLDEIDKLGGPELRGDPAGALLEALDPEQNDAFEDHYLAMAYDLSQVIFVCTANDLHRIPAVLRDRLEIIELGGYTVEEKIAIGREYLLPRSLEDHGLSDTPVSVSDEVLLSLATEYTRESGVRNLQRELEALLRDTAMELAQGHAPPERLDRDDLLRVLGPPKYHDERIDHAPSPGVVTGLGWTPTGGRLLIVEVTLTGSHDGEGKLRLTGRLGDVMQESAQTALSLVRSDAERYGLDSKSIVKQDVHVHVPSGAVPKDGPSAGITLTTALVSALTRRPARTDVAMTGEVTLHGHVLPIGGVREKVLAAHRAGIRDVILPRRNAKDEPDIPDKVRQELQLHYVDHVDDVLALCLLDPLPSPEQSADAAQ